MVASSDSPRLQYIELSGLRSLILELGSPKKKPRSCLRPTTQLSSMVRAWDWPSSNPSSVTMVHAFQFVAILEMAPALSSNLKAGRHRKQSPALAPLKFKDEKSPSAHHR